MLEPRSAKVKMRRTQLEKIESASIQLLTELPDDLAKVICVLLNDPTCLLQARWLGLGLIGLGGLGHGQSLEPTSPANH